MAGVGDSVVVSRSEEVNEDERSLAELIERELAARELAYAEAAAREICTQAETARFLASERLSSDEWTTVGAAVAAMTNPANPDLLDGLDCRAPDRPELLLNGDHSALLDEQVIDVDDDVEDVREVITEVREFVEIKEDQFPEFTNINGDSKIIISQEVETVVTEKKTKKKKTTENGDVTTKSKKKKSKKSEEKENHISVELTNGHGCSVNENGVHEEENNFEHNHVMQYNNQEEQEEFDSQIQEFHSQSQEFHSQSQEFHTQSQEFNSQSQEFDSQSPPPQIIDEDELSNVCVKNLKQSYVNEAAKAFNTPAKSTEEPVPPSIPIRELRRSFGDIHRACENSDLSPTLDDDSQLKSSFSKFDQLSKKTFHVRSSDPAKAQKTFSQGGDGDNAQCKACGKTVFVMEQIKAERAVWHKNCFRCHTCNKQLTVDIYQSHEGELYCKPHFKELFQPKAVIEPDEPTCDKPDLGLEELSSLNVKSKFQVFEKGNEKSSELDRSPSKVDVKRSASILSKLAKFQKKGMDIGVTDEDLDGFAYEESSSEEEDEEDEVDDAGVVKCRKIREKPMSFGKMDDVKKSFESGATSKEQRLEERKQEMHTLRSRLFQGKQVKMKEMYEQAVAESEGKVSRKESDVVRSDKAKEFRERFEKGKVIPSDDEDDSKPKIAPDELTVFEEGISKKSRSLFLEMDAKTQSEPKPPVTPPKPKQRESEESPEREIYRDPTIVRADDKLEDEVIIKRSQTASKMLSIFKQLEEQKEVLPDGPKPKKEFTPPPDFRGGSESSEEEDDEDEEEEETESDEEDADGIVKSSSRVDDEFLQVKNAVRARELAAKFESWEPEKQSANNAVAMLESEQPSLESTKSLRAHFESLKNQKNQQESKSRPKVNRFVDSPPTICSSCEGKVYPLEKIETDGRIFHKACFRCSHCNCILRMDSYTLNNGHLYCLPHFKQLFISKGNYDEGFGVDQHKRKWELSGTPVNGSA